MNRANPPKIVTKQLFPLGQTVITRNAATEIDGESIAVAMHRHQSGDWGDVCAEDKDCNDLALREGSHLLSVYYAANGTKFWIITEWDRSVTTVLLPEDY